MTLAIAKWVKIHNCIRLTEKVKARISPIYTKRYRIYFIAFLISIKEVVADINLKMAIKDIATLILLSSLEFPEFIQNNNIILVSSFNLETLLNRTYLIK